jgi:hypothetical protein
VKLIRHGTPRWPEPVALHGQKLRRWTSHRPALKNVLELVVDHPAVVEGRTCFRREFSTPPKSDASSFRASPAERLAAGSPKGHGRAREFLRCRWKKEQVALVPARIGELATSITCPYEASLPWTGVGRANRPGTDRIDQTASRGRRNSRACIRRFLVPRLCSAMGAVADPIIFVFSDIARILRDPASGRRSEPSRGGIGQDSQSGSPTPRSRLDPLTLSTIGLDEPVVREGIVCPAQTAVPRHAPHADFAGPPIGTLSSPLNASSSPAVYECLCGGLLGGRCEGLEWIDCFVYAGDT